MNKIYLFHTKTAFIAAMLLAVCMSMPCAAFAFRNPNQEPQEAVQPQESESIRPAGSGIPAGPDAGAQDFEENDNSGSTSPALLSVGEISMTSPQAIPLREACGFDAFNQLHQNRWQATFSKETGRVKRLYGAASKPSSGTAEQAAREFLHSAHAVFGLQEDLSDLTTQQVSDSGIRQHVRFQQTREGVPVLGAQVLVHADSAGRVTMVQNDSLESIEIANRNTLTPDEAKDIAIVDLQAHLGSAASLSAAAAEQLIAPYRGRYAYIWKVTTPSQNPPGLWVCHVDAETGEILYRADELLYLKNGKGRAYLNNDMRFINKINTVPLKYMFTPTEGRLQGLLHGLRATIYDYNLDYAFEPNLNFNYDAVIDKFLFDQAHAYYQKTAVWEWWDKNVIKKYGPRNIKHFYTLSIPVVVNIGGYCNAFYAPVNPLNPVSDNLPGFSFGDENSCPWFNEDFVIDNDIVRHEYAHAIMDWAGFYENGQFGGAVDGYGRAMGEGNSDWYAFLVSGKPAVCYVTFPPYGLRNIDNPNRYPYDVDCPYCLTTEEIACPDADPLTPEYDGTPMPQEHHTGQIWGGYLYDLSRVLKKNALRYVYTSSFYFSPAGGHRDGFSDFADAVRAQFAADLDRNGNNAQSLKAFGSMVSRGFIRALPDSDMYSHPCNYFGTGLPGADTQDSIWLSTPLKLNTPANLLNDYDQHEYPFEASAGMLMVAQVTTPKGGLKAPVIALYTSDGVLLTAVDFSANPFVTKAAMNYTIPSSGRYVVRVSGMNASPARGHYTFQLTVQ